MAGINKKALVAKIIAQLTQELKVMITAARAAHSEATHEQSRADNKYDTRGLEAAYLARGQSKQVAETEQAIELFQVLALKPFGSKDPIDLGAYIELESNGETDSYFMGPRAGGCEIQIQNREILVITPQSPLGQQLLGKCQGEVLKLVLGGVPKVRTVARVL